jgi:hypothetical protein
MKGIALALAAVSVAAIASTKTDYVSAKRKFQQIDTRQTGPGSRVPITSQELNAYVQTELPAVAPPGIRRPRVELLGNNTASGSALIDFVKLRSAQGKSTPWLMRKLLEGEREVKVTTHVKSANGTATVDIEQVEIGGIPIQGTALDFLIENYLIPNYPEAKIGQPFKLHKNIDRIEVAPGIAYVTLKR